MPEGSIRVCTGPSSGSYPPTSVAGPSLHRDELLDSRDDLEFGAPAETAAGSGRVASSVDNSMIESSGPPCSASSSTSAIGGPTPSSDRRSSNGSRPVTASAVDTPRWACSPHTSSKPFTPPRSTRHDHHTPPLSGKPGQAPGPPRSHRGAWLHTPRAESAASPRAERPTLISAVACVGRFGSRTSPAAAATRGDQALDLLPTSTQEVDELVDVLALG
jgi:hypothetical protein